MGCVKILKSGLTAEQAFMKLKLSKPLLQGLRISKPATLWKHEQMSLFKDFSRLYNNKEVVPTLEAMEKKIVFYHDKRIDMLKLGCTLPNLVNNCLQKSTDAKLYPFM